MKRVEGSATASRRTGMLLILALFGFFTIIGLLDFGYFYLGGVAMDGGDPAGRVLLDELTGSYATAVLLIAVVAFSRRFRIRRDNWESHLPLYGGALVAFSGLKTTMMWGSRSALAPVLGLGAYDYGAMWVRYPMEFFNDVTTFLVAVAGVHAWLVYRDSRDREVRTARLEARLADARLSGLEGQLRPHFLFNSLNAVSSVLYRSPDEADRILGRLSDLLRYSMAVPDRHQVSFAEELDSAETYLDIVRSRFGDRLDAAIDVNPNAEDARVPRLLLQPLIENAVKHGLGRVGDAGWIRIGGSLEGDRVRITVEDDGPGLVRPPGESLERGTGLRNVEERLRLIHGADAVIRLEDRHPRGVRAVIEVPYVPSREEGPDPRTEVSRTRSHAGKATRV